MSDHSDTTVQIQMNSDETSRAESTMVRSASNSGLSSVVVLVADRDPSVTDELATVLRGHFTVRSAYDSADALASLDPEVSVALVDPDIPGLSVHHVIKRVQTDAVDCQIAALTDERIDLDASAFDEYLVKPVAPEHLTATVERLSKRALYRTTLEEYYQIASDRATTDDPERRAELERRLSELDDRLGDAMGGLDGADAYDAALRQLDVDS